MLVVYIQTSASHSPQKIQAVDLTIVPNSQTSATADALKQKIAPPLEVPGQKTVTNSVSEEFAQQYAALQQNGTWNTDTQAKLITDITTSYATTSPHGLALSDISTFSDRDTEKIRVFGNQSAKTIINYYPALKNSPLDILSQSQTSGEATSTLPAKLIPISQAYRSVALNLQKISAPANEAANYLAVINGYILIADSIDDMKTYYTDPVRGLRGLSGYQKNLLSQIDLLKNIASYLNSNGILFSNTEDGRIWSSLLQ